MTKSEKVLIEIVRVNRKEISDSYLQYYIQRNGSLSNEAEETVRQLLEEKTHE